MASKKFKVACILGTRPEAVKMAPVILELQTRPEMEVLTISTGQHRDMTKHILDGFAITPDIDLGIMKESQTLEEITISTLSKLSPVLEEVKPGIVLVQGDTTSAFASALCAFYKKIRVGHIEAGLRSYSKDDPYPEEINRCLLSKLADIHFAPTVFNKETLIKEGIEERDIYVTGNTVIDALFLQLERLGDRFSSRDLELFFQSSTRKIIVTAHRRENLGQGMINICEAVRQIMENIPDVEVLVSAHPNPEARRPIKEILGSNPKVKIVEPLDYFDFILAVSKSFIILTDSGGIQEEAPSLGKPVLVLRNVTERKEGVDAGVVRLVGTEVGGIVREASLLLSDFTEYQKMTTKVGLYGDGQASRRIANCLDEINSSRYVFSKEN